MAYSYGTHPDFPELDYDPVWETDTAYFMRLWGDEDGCRKLLLEIAIDLTVIERKRNGEGKEESSEKAH
jgi:hypothetical protein